MHNDEVEATIRTVLKKTYKADYNRDSKEADMEEYRGWNNVPRGFKTKSQWDLLNRKVRKQESPKGEVAFSVLKRTGSSGTIHEDGTEEHREPEVVVDVQRAKLYDEEQTRPYNPSPLELAHRAYYGNFVGHTSRDYYIWITDEGWIWSYGLLGRQRVRSHIYGKSEYGVIGGGGSEVETTRFGLIDHDLHENGDLEVFLEQQRVLIAEFYGRDGWHFQVKNEHAGGAHLIQVVPETYLSDYRQQLRTRLQQLDTQHPQLAQRAKTVGMRTLGQLEIYPDTTNGIRLPLASGRTALLDRPLSLIPNCKGRLVQDVVGYIKWISDPQRSYMESDDVYDYIRARLAEPQPRSPTLGLVVEADRAETSFETTVTGRRLNDFRTQHRSWPKFIDSLANNGVPAHDCVGEVIYELAKWLLHVELSHLDDGQAQDRTIELLNVFVAERNNGFVSRWSRGKENAVTNQIARIVRRASALCQEYRGVLAAIRKKQDDGNYKKVLRIEPIILGVAESEGGITSPNTTPTPHRTTYISLQVLNERGLLAKCLPNKVQKVIAEAKGRQKIEPFARRLLNALYCSPGHKRLVSYADMYQLLGDDFRRGGKPKPTTISLYLKTLQNHVGLIRPGRRYRKGQMANEYLLTEHAAKLFEDAQGDERVA